MVIGHDHRHHSARWARLTGLAFIAQGVKVYLLRGLVHTPMCEWSCSSNGLLSLKCLMSLRVPFGVKRLHAACGVMITGDIVAHVQIYLLNSILIASHNPKVREGSPYSMGQIHLN